MTIWTPTLPSEDRPLYKALARALETDIASGALKPGEKLPTHRDLADHLGVNVSTVTRAYSEAERKGLVAGTVGRGTFVASSAGSPATFGPDESPSPVLELGLATPLYGFDPDLGPALAEVGSNPANSASLAGLMRYSPPSGLPQHREAGAAWAGRYNMRADPDEVVVTAGSQHGLFCALAAAFTPGGRLAVDALTYPGLRRPAAMLGLTLMPVAMDGEGMLPESLDNLARSRELAGLYLTPSLHNPTTACMGETRRENLARIIRDRNLTLVEDDPYALCLEVPPAPLSARVPNHSVFIAGTSKFLGAGLRTGFAVCRGKLHRETANAVLATTWMAPPLGAELASRWIMDGSADRARAAKIKEARTRFDLAGTTLSGHTVHGFPGSFFIWLELPEPWTGRDLEAAAAREGVSVFGAERFVVGDAPLPRAARIALTGAQDRDSLATGLARIRDILSAGPMANGPML